MVNEYKSAIELRHRHAGRLITTYYGFLSALQFQMHDVNNIAVASVIICPVICDHWYEELCVTNKDTVVAVATSDMFYGLPMAADDFEYFFYCNAIFKIVVGIC